jgi:signal-transduction protein with cAMP-binding, CBS, and nucleotidyltransferase domain
VTQFYDAGGKIQIKSLSELMKSPLKVIPADLNIFEANAIMLFEKVRRLPVIDNGKIIGIVTQTDLVHACFDYVETLRPRLTGKVPDALLLPLRQKESIISQYVSEHLRAYTMK